jgi:hypothetical protein
MTLSIICWYITTENYNQFDNIVLQPESSWLKKRRKYEKKHIMLMAWWIWAIHNE